MYIKCHYLLLIKIYHYQYVIYVLFLCLCPVSSSSPLDEELVNEVLEDIPRHEEDYLDVTLDEEQELMIQIRSRLDKQATSSGWEELSRDLESPNQCSCSCSTNEYEFKTVNAFLFSNNIESKKNLEETLIYTMLIFLVK